LATDKKVAGMSQVEAYRLAQRAMADLKSAICQLLLSTEGTSGLTNSAIGRLLGIYHGHVRHEGHIPRTLLAVMEAEGVVEQDPTTKRWRVRKHVDSDAVASGSNSPAQGEQE
jgi:hypothetical protein